VSEEDYASDEFNAQAKLFVEKRLQKGKSGPLESLVNCVTLLETDPGLRGLLSMDRFANRILKTRAPPWSDVVSEWTETDTTLLRYYLASEYRIEFSMLNLDQAIVRAAETHGFHPVRDYLNGLVWDGEPRVSVWLGAYLDATRYSNAVHRQYVSLIGSMWMVAAVARVFEPGCKFDNVLILEGAQGIGKSTAMSLLAGDWYLDTPFPIGEKDGYQALAGVWLAELSELDNFSSVESTRSKAFFSSSTDRYRPPYGRTVAAYPRQCVFVGTTNQYEYLKDSTGNRRYWPVRVYELARDELAADRDQLWAEAVQLYRAGFRYYLAQDDALRAVFEAEQAVREIGDPWEIAIQDWLAEPDVRAMEGVTLYEVLRNACKVEPNRMDQRAMATRVGKIMRRLGYRKQESGTRDARRGPGRFLYVIDSCQT
jgi:putative DNA primase/helicase